MSGIMDLINSDLGKQIIGSITEKTGINPEQAGSVVSNGLPEILARMQQNTDSGDSGLLGALTGGKHDGSILDNLSGYFGADDYSDGSKILGHVFGGDAENVASSLSQKTGVDSGIISKILPMLAPIIMGYLGKKMAGGASAESGASAGGIDLGGLLGGLLGGQSSGGSSMGGGILNSVLDQDGDGQIGLGDAITAINNNGGGSGGNSGGGFLGGLLGKLFGKK